MTAIFMAMLVQEGADPVTAILTRDWAALGGWSLLIGTWVVIVTGAFREWWVPGGRYRRLETAAALNSDTLNTTVKTLDKTVTANEITKHFFEETAPKRRGMTDEDFQPTSV